MSKRRFSEGEGREVSELEMTSEVLPSRRGSFFSDKQLVKTRVFFFFFSFFSFLFFSFLFFSFLFFFSPLYLPLTSFPPRVSVTSTQ